MHFGIRAGPHKVPNDCGSALPPRSFALPRKKRVSGFLAIPLDAYTTHLKLEMFSEGARGPVHCVNSPSGKEGR